MENQEAKSKWDELVRQLGAEVTPETEQLVEAGPAPPAEPASNSIRSSSYEGIEPPLAAPKRPAAGWDNLANEFGLPAPPEPAPPAIEEAAAVTKQVPASRAADADRPRREPRDGDRRERHGKRRESHEEGRQASHQRRERREQSREPSHGGREQPDRHRKSPKFRERRESREGEPRVAEGSQDKLDQPAPIRPQREEPKPAPVEDRPKPGPAVSLWHKIFGSPSDQSAKLEEISTRTDDENSARTAGDEDSLVRDLDIDRNRADDDEIETRAPEQFEPGQIDRGMEGEADSEQVERDERRPHRARRRRRGRGGRGESGAGAEQRAGRSQRRKAEHQQDGDEFDGGDGDEEDSELTESQEISESDDSEAGDVAGDENGAQRSGRSRPSLQRNIPSWDEAIGFIVDANMQSRSQRRQSGASGSRSGSPRGRSRGRRRN